MEKIEYNKPLKEYNSFGLEAAADRFLVFDGVDDLRAFFAASESREPWYVLSGGNNVIFTGDYPGTILHPVSKGIRIINESDTEVMVDVAGGEEWDDVVSWAVEHGFGGIENLSVIPGYTGAAPVQNIGAYGVEIKDLIREVEVYLPETDQVVWMTAEVCRFGYRDSIFKRELKAKAVILSVRMALQKQPVFKLDYGDLKSCVGGTPTLLKIREAVIDIRNRKLPDPKSLPNAGSFFKNPVVDRSVAEKIRAAHPDMPAYPVDETSVKLAAGWLIDRAGWKGARHGNVGMHSQQALVMVNHGGATGAEILDFARGIQTDLFEKFGVKVEMEVNVL